MREGDSSSLLSGFRDNPRLYLLRGSADKKLVYERGMEKEVIGEFINFLLQFANPKGYNLNK